jgi:hypothetical protein
MCWRVGEEWESVVLDGGINGSTPVHSGVWEEYGKST